jgi:hypothetical protein
MKEYTINTAQYFSLLFFVLSFLCLADFVHGTDHIIESNITFYLIHLITGMGFLVFSRLGTETSIYFIRSVGLAYLLISLIGFQVFQEAFLQTNSQWSHVFYLNLMNYLHFVLGIILSFSGTILNNRRRQIAITGYG